MSSGKQRPSENNAKDYEWGGAKYNTGNGIILKLFGEVVSVEDVLQEVEKDSVFYHNSGGGVTLSGGEPTMQPEFATGILKGSMEPLEDDTDSDAGHKPGRIPYGLVSYRLRVANYGDTATVKIYLSKPAPVNAKWVFYDTISGWQDFSDHAEFNNDRTEVTLELKDGAFGDNDHTENKVIVDPSGIGIYEADSSGGGGGCFISTALNE